MVDESGWTEDLECCPFCKDPHVFFQVMPDPKDHNDYPVPAIICRKCGFMMTSYERVTKQQLIEKWNHRAEPCVKMGFREELLNFATDMEITLKLNDYKGGWEHESVDYLMKRLDDGITELKIALDFAQSAEEKKRECVDVANFAMMLYDVLSLCREEK